MKINFSTFQIAQALAVNHHRMLVVDVNASMLVARFISCHAPSADAEENDKKPKGIFSSTDEIEQALENKTISLH